MSTVQLEDGYGSPVFIRAEAVTGVSKCNTGQTEVVAGGVWRVSGTVEEVQAIIANAQMPVGEVMVQHLVAVHTQVAAESEGHYDRMAFMSGSRRALEVLATRLGLVLPPG